MWKCKEWWNIQLTVGIWCGPLSQHPLPPARHQPHLLIPSTQTTNMPDRFWSNLKRSKLIHVKQKTRGLQIALRAYSIQKEQRIEMSEEFVIRKLELIFLRTSKNWHFVCLCLVYLWDSEKYCFYSMPYNFWSNLKKAN